MHIGTQVSRLLPWTMKNYKLDEITTLADLRKNVALLFRQNAHIKDPKVETTEHTPSLECLMGHDGIDRHMVSDKERVCLRWSTYSFTRGGRS